MARLRSEGARPWIVDLAPGAEENDLAVELAGVIRKNLERGEAVSDFLALRASVLMVAQDLGESFTLRFDHGRLTVHDGNVGVPSVTFCGDANALRALSHVLLSPRLRFPILSPFSGDGRNNLAFLGSLFVSDFTVYGLVAHPRTVLAILRLLRVPD